MWAEDEEGVFLALRLGTVWIGTTLEIQLEWVPQSSRNTTPTVEPKESPGVLPRACLGMVLKWAISSTVKGV